MRRSLAGVAALATALLVMTGYATGLTPSGAQTDDLPRHSDVITSTKLAADYYQPTFGPSALTPKNGWSWSTYAQGLQALYRQSGAARYLDNQFAWGQANSWGLTHAELDPDSMKAAQTYYDLNKISPAADLTTADQRMAEDFAHLPVTQYDWADALFMGLPNWTRWAVRTGNPAYLTKMDDLYAWAKDQGATSTRCAAKPAPTPALFDAAEGLWYRDCRFVSVQDPNGKKVFWARGNGWVIAAMAQVIQTLPVGDPHATKYAAMLKTMAAKLVTLQGTDGMWRASLEDPALYPTPETSGTALITYALAYGIRTGLLDAPTYLPAVAKAWQGLTTISLQPNGFLTNCQTVGDSPGPAYTAKAPRTPPTSTNAGTVNTDEAPYCAGAFLLAGSEVVALTSSPSTGRTVTATGQQAGNEATRINDGDVTTRWSASGFPRSATIDLGADYRLSNAVLVPYLDRAYRYRIETSTDNLNWTLVVDRSTNTTGGTQVSNFAQGTVNARYARLTVVGVSGVVTPWVSIQEFGVYDRFNPRVDLARAHTTTGTSAATGHAVTAATDGVSTTWWSAAVVPTAAKPQYVTVNLGAITPVDTVRLFSRAGAGPKHITISVSTLTGAPYTTVAAADLPNTEGPTAVMFPKTNARWVRVSATSSYVTNTVSIEQFEVFRSR